MSYSDHRIGIRVKQQTAETKRLNTTLKVNRGCKICGYSKCPDALDWHHFYPKTKAYKLSDIRTIPLLFREIAKCICVCANCHSEIHAGLHPEYLEPEEKIDDEDSQISLKF